MHKVWPNLIRAQARPRISLPSPCGAVCCLEGREGPTLGSDSCAIVEDCSVDAVDPAAVLRDIGAMCFEDRHSHLAYSICIVPAANADVVGMTERFMSLGRCGDFRIFVSRLPVAIDRHHDQGVPVWA